MTVLTNGERIAAKDSNGLRPLRQFRLIAEHEGSAWVQAINGNYEGELLTFDRSVLTEIDA